MKNGDILETYLCVDVARIPHTGEGYFIHTYKVPMTALNNVVQGPLNVEWETLKIERSAKKG